MGQDRGAEELFQLGRSAMAGRDYDKACRYFQASLDAEFTLGTLLNLAICHEQAGKIASAWAEYRVLEDRARRATPPQPDRVRFAEAHGASLYPRLSRIRIKLSPETAVTKGLVVKIDGTAVARELFDAGVPVDTGQHTVSALAPERESWSQRLIVIDERLVLETTVPELARVAAKPVRLEAEHSTPDSPQRTIGIVVG